MTRFFITICVLSSLCLAVACGEPASEPIELDEENQNTEEPREPRDYDGPIGGDRPVTAEFPDDYDVEGNHPLLIQLHGFGSNAFQTRAFFETGAEARARGVVILTPEGTTNNDGEQFWNATEMCCDWGNSGVDDVAYLTGLIEEAVEKYAVDPERVFFMGLSNGGFMSHRMACERGDLVRGIVSFNGASFNDAQACDPDHPVEIIHIHATDDDIVPYDGHNWLPSAQEVVERWVDWNECDPEAVMEGRIDLAYNIEGDETVIESWQNCVDGGAVQFWTMEGAPHVPYPLNDFGPTIFDVLLAD